MMRLLWSLLLILVTASAHGQVELANPVDCPPYVVVFGNGVRTTQRQAEANLIALSARTPEKRDGYTVEMKLAWARSGRAPGVTSLYNDFLESFGQFLASNARVGWSSFFRLLAGAEELDGVRVPPGYIDGVNRLFVNQLIALSADVGRAASEASADVDRHIQTLYKPELLAGKRLVVVAHSQGNFFANEAYRRLSADPDIGPAPRLRLASAANPAPYVAGTDRPRYVTAEIDAVIGPIPGALPSNVEFSLIAATAALVTDFTGHGFSEIYLNEAWPTAALLQSKINEAFNDLPNNCFFIRVNPTGTYLSSMGSRGPATAVPLSSLAAEGAGLQMTRQGAFVFDPISNPGQTASGLTAVFVGGGGFAGPAANSTVTPVVTLPSCRTATPGPSTDIPQDFGLQTTPSIAYAPPSAATLIFGPDDCFFDDNSDPSGTFGVKLVVLPPTRQ